MPVYKESIIPPELRRYTDDIHGFFPLRLLSYDFFPYLQLFLVKTSDYMTGKFVDERPFDEADFWEHVWEAGVHEDMEASSGYRLGRNWNHKYSSTDTLITARDFIRWITASKEASWNTSEDFPDRGAVIHFVTLAQVEPA